MRKSLIAFSFAFALLSAIGCLAGCDQHHSNKLDVVCTIFPQYDWAKVLAAGNDNVNLTLLQDSGIDLHNYQASAADKVKIMNCSLLIYVGGESDQWVEEILENSSSNPDRKIVKLLDEVDALDEEEVPGGEEHDHEEDHEQEEDEKDEHIWLSLLNAQKLCRSIAKAFQQIDSDHQALYENNLQNYLKELESLEKEYANTAKNAKQNVLLFGDRFPFRYLVEDYDLQYYAAFSGCSAETEASFEVIKKLAEAVNTHNLSYILVLESSDQKIAEQIKSSTSTKNQTILVINSIQSVTKKQIGEGVNYLSLMRENLDVLKTALN